MPELTPLSGTVALAAAFPPSAGPAEHGLRFVAVEPVARVKGFGTRVSGGRDADLATDNDGEARASGLSSDDARAATLATGRSADPFAGPSTGFLAQYIGQALVADGIASGQTGSGYTAYRAVAESDITYLGLQAPVDLFV